jgi:8-oxo-dGTP diphosphatase
MAEGHTHAGIPGRQRHIAGKPHADGIVAFQRPEYRFCPLCGTRLEDRAAHGEVRPTCPACGFVAYYNPSPAVGAVILSGDRVLLVRRAYQPRKGLWSLPAGFMEFGERQIDALAREVREETGLEITSGTLVSVEDASEDPRTHALLIAFLVDEWSGEPKPGDDADEVGWFPLDALPEMAWKNHGRVIGRVREVLGA